MDIKKTGCLLLLSTVILLAGNTLSYSIEDHDEHDELFKTVELKDGKVLSITDCVSLAYKNSPKIRRKKYELDVAKSNVGLAKSRFFPVFNAGVGIGFDRNSNHIYYDKRFRDLPAVGVSLNQLIWDFGKSTSFIKMEEFYKIGAEYEFMDILCYTLFDIKAKYYELLRAKALFNSAKNDVEMNEQFVKLAHNKGSADLANATINLSQSKIKFIEAENNLYNAKYNLSNEMYIDNQPNYDIESTPTFTYNDSYKYGTKNYEKDPFSPYKFPFEIKDAPEIAYKNSPDLQVLISTRKAMEQALKYVKRTYMPELTADVGYSYNNSKNTDEKIHNHGLHVGVNLSTSINLMELRHSIKGADAQLNIADNEIKLFKKDLYYELQRAFNNVDRAKKQIPTAKTEVEQALKTFNIVIDEYEKDIGDVDYTMLQDARKDYILALNHYINSVYDYNIALIQVEMAMHYHLVDIHHKSEHALHYHSSELLEHLNKVLDCDEKEVKKTTSKKSKKKAKSSK